MSTKYLKNLILFIAIFSFVISSDMRIVIGEASLTESDIKRYKRGYGNKIDKYKNLQVVWPEAERNAAQNALLKEFNKLLVEEDVNKYLPLLKNDIYPVAEGFIVDKRFMSQEIKDPGKLVLRFEMAIDVDRFKLALEDIGVSFDVKTRKTVMLLIEEFFKPDYIPSNKGALKKEVIKKEILDSKEYDKSIISSGKKESISGQDENFESQEDVDELYMLEMKRERKKIVREYFPPDLSGSKIDISAALTEIGKLLLDIDVNLIDEEFTKQMRNEFLGEDGYLPNMINDDSEIAKFAATAREKFAADMVVIGCVNSVYNGKESYKGKSQHATTSNLIVKMVDTANGQILGYEQGSESAVGIAATVAAQLSSSEVGITIGETLATSMADYIKKREEKGYEYVIFFQGTALKTKHKHFFIKHLEALEASSNVNVRSWDKDSQTLEVWVTFKGSTSEFQDALYPELWDDPTFSDFEESKSKGSTIFLELN